MQRFIDTAELSDGLRQPGRPVANLERTHDASGGHPSKFERSSQTEHIVPMRRNLLQTM
jgi:hypothetical protein